MPKLIKRRVSLSGIITVIATLTISSLWFVSDPGWEPLLSLVLGVGAIAAVEKAAKSSRLDKILFITITALTVVGVLLLLSMFATSNIRIILWLYGKPGIVTVVSLVSLALTLLGFYVYFFAAADTQKQKKLLRRSSRGRKYSDKGIRRTASVLVIAAILTVVTINWGYRSWLSASPRRTIVLVAEFRDPSGIDSNQLTRALVDTLNESLDEELDIHVQSLGFAVEGKTFEDREALAKKVREAARASVIIWGDYVLEPSLELQVHFDTSRDWPQGFDVQEYRVLGEEQVKQASSLNPEYPSMFAFKVALGEHFAQLVAILQALVLAETGNLEASQEAFSLALTYDNVVLGSDIRETIYMYRGSNYYDLGLFDLALTDYDTVIGMNLQNPHAYYNRALVYYEQQMISTALTDYSTAISLDPGYIAAYNNRGNIYHTQGKFDEAIKDYTKAIEVYPDFAYGYHNRGLVFADLGEDERAIEELSKAISLDPEYMTAYYNRGTIFMERGDYETAIVDFSKCIDLDPNYTVATIRRSMAYTLAGDFRLAIDDATSVIRIDPNSAVAYYSRARAYAQLGDNDKALLDYAKALELDPELTPLLLDRGLFYEEAGQIEKAIADFTQVIETNPERPEGYLQRGIILLERGDSISAERDFLRALQLSKDNYIVHHYLGRAYDDQEQHVKAVAHYTIYLKHEPTDAYTFFLRGSCQWILRDYKAAIEDLNLAINLELEDRGQKRGMEALYFMRALVYRDMGDYSTSIADFTSAVESDPRFTPGYYHRGLVYFRMKEYEQAVQDFSATIQLAPSDYSTYVDRGKAYVELGKPKNALSDLRTYLSNVPDAHDRAEIEQLIEELSK